MNAPSVLEHADAPVSTGEAAALCRAAWGLDGDLTRLTGERDQNFRLVVPGGGSFLLKLSNSAEPREVTDLQTQALLHLEAVDPDLPTPRLIRTLSGAAAHLHQRADASIMVARLMAFLSGQPATSDLRVSDLRRLGETIARLDRALAGFEHPGDSPDLLWDLQHAARLDSLSVHIADAPRRSLAERALALHVERAAVLGEALRRQVIHNDLNPHNVLVSAAPFAVTGVLDFGDAVRAPLVQELAVAASYYLGPAEAAADRLSALVAGYCSVLRLEERELEALPAMVVGRLAMTVLITAWRARRHPENAAYILRNAPAAWASLEALMAGGLPALEARVRAEARERTP